MQNIQKQSDGCKKVNNKEMLRSAGKANMDKLKKEIDIINLTTANNRYNVPLICLTGPDENDEDVDNNNNDNYQSNLNTKSQPLKKSNEEFIKIMAVTMNQTKSAIIDEIQELSIPFDLKSVKCLSNESYAELPVKLESQITINKFEDIAKIYKKDCEDCGILNYEHVLLELEEKKVKSIQKTSKIIPAISSKEYLYFYTDTATFINIFEKRKINTQQVFHEKKIISAIVLLTTPPSSSDSEILLQMYGPGVPLNLDSIKCYIQFKLQILVNFQNSIIDLNDGKYLCLKPIQLDKLLAKPCRNCEMNDYSVNMNIKKNVQKKEEIDVCDCIDTPVSINKQNKLVAKSDTIINKPLLNQTISDFNETETCYESLKRKVESSVNLENINNFEKSIIFDDSTLSNNNSTCSVIDERNDQKTKY